jgi:hypothetical protein
MRRDRAPSIIAARLNVENAALSASSLMTLDEARKAGAVARSMTATTAVGYSADPTCEPPRPIEEQKPRQRRDHASDEQKSSLVIDGPNAEVFRPRKGARDASTGVDDAVGGEVDVVGQCRLVEVSGVRRTDRPEIERPLNVDPFVGIERLRIPLAGDRESEKHGGHDQKKRQSTTLGHGAPTPAGTRS